MAELIHKERQNQLLRRDEGDDEDLCMGIEHLEVEFMATMLHNAGRQPTGRRFPELIHDLALRIANDSPYVLDLLKTNCPDLVPSLSTTLLHRRQLRQQIFG